MYSPTHPHHAPPHHTTPHHTTRPRAGWGDGADGVLGLGNTRDIGDDEPPVAGGYVNFGAGVRIAKLGRRSYGTCALTEFGKVFCWGNGLSVENLGYPGFSGSIGDDETPHAFGPVPLGECALDIAGGTNGVSTCVLLSGGRVKCWGGSTLYSLGVGTLTPFGYLAAPRLAPVVPLPGPAVKVVHNYATGFALLANGSIMGWGSGSNGVLGRGVGTANARTPVMLPALGAPVVDIVEAEYSVAALLADGSVRTWGTNWAGHLGLASTADIGDDESLLSVPAVSLGGSAIQLSAFDYGFCSVLTPGASGADGYCVKCWGGGDPNNVAGVLGIGPTGDVGDDETPEFSRCAVTVCPAGPSFPLPTPTAPVVSAGGSHTCVLMPDARVRCFGANAAGQLGLGTTVEVGGAVPVDMSRSANVGGPVAAVSCGDTHTCALLTNGSISWCVLLGRLCALVFARSRVARVPHVARAVRCSERAARALTVA